MCRPLRIRAIAQGELLDRITILEIKCRSAANQERRQTAESELGELVTVRDQTIRMTPEIGLLVVELRALNERLWDAEDRIRLSEQQGDFGPKFVELAPTIYLSNDARSAVKQQINSILGSSVETWRITRPLNDHLCGSMPSTLFLPVPIEDTLFPHAFSIKLAASELSPRSAQARHADHARPGSLPEPPARNPGYPPRHVRTLLPGGPGKPAQRRGRPTRPATYITEVIRRLTALLMLGDELDANYRAGPERAMDSETWKG